MKEVHRERLRVREREGGGKEVRKEGRRERRRG